MRLPQALPRRREQLRRPRAHRLVRLQRRLRRRRVLPRRPILRLPAGARILLLRLRAVPAEAAAVAAAAGGAVAAEVAAARTDSGTLEALIGLSLENHARVSHDFRAIPGHIGRGRILHQLRPSYAEAPPAVSVATAGPRPHIEIFSLRTVS